MGIKKPTHSVVVSYIALFLALGGSAAAATGGAFILGRSNSASSTTLLTNGAGVPLALNARSGSAPLSVNSATKVARLNADKLDGLDSTQMQRRVSTTCPSGQAMKGASSSGAPICTLLAPPPATGPVQSTDKGWSISDLQLFVDSLGDWDGRARITNGNSTTKTGTFTVTVFRNGTVIAVLRGSASDVAPGNTYTVELVSTDDWSAGDYTTTFQTDASY